MDVNSIKTVGIGGQYLTQPQTLKRCRTEFYTTDFFNRQNHAGWKSAGSRRIDQTAARKVRQRLAAYEKPAIDNDVERELKAYVARHKGSG
jgi:trimethylamine--corrinoid protein Co-methyltransferase